MSQCFTYSVHKSQPAQCVLFPDLLSAFSSIDHITLLEGVIVLEEFCKELAAIAFVKYHASATP